MKRVCLALTLPLLLIAASPAAPQTPPAPQAEEEKGFDLMQEGAKLLFRGLMREMEPALNEMGKALSEMEPALEKLMVLIDDIRNYDAPRLLDNGDILIPRRKDAPKPLPIPEGEIEL
ncbi:AAA+ family ATPase [Pseudotabrizicola alkalilacus]|uniref:AAA+ family ATPase n=1 Tax=Pseudotabrizicola alkalilacus TaxID=2305252 RepID=A0A411Z743_9RHOB|nr:AAA+ family ATPase [Pseudotabrizicola alkalilacus]RGP38891.1 AAA+ family ATPase [Pseudotabrizicola alkalilacus]